MENENEISNKKLEYIKGFAYLANIFFIASLFMPISEQPARDIVFRLIWLILMYFAVSKVANIAKSSSLMTCYKLFIASVIFANIITLPALDSSNIPLGTAVAIAILTIIFLAWTWMAMFFKLAEITGEKLFKWCIYSYIICIVALSATFYTLLNSFQITDAIKGGFGVTVLIFIITQIFYFSAWSSIKTIKVQENVQENDAG